MSPAIWARAKEVFEIAVNWPPDQRGPLLEARCAGDDELLLLVQDLLRGHDQDSGILDVPAAEQSLFTGLAQNGIDSALHPGDELAGRFRVVRLIGSGGMGDVYEAEDLNLDNAHVAIKTIRSPIVWEPRIEAQFRQEVYLARKVTHPNVCRIHEFFVHQSTGPDGEPHRTYFYSMELLPGASLKEALRDGAIRPEEVPSLLTQLASGLAAAHDAGVVHGDFKAANVLVVGAGSELRAIITDFGLAKPARSTEAERISGSLIGGTPQYLAPEVLEGHAPTPASDIFAFGVVALELYSGGVPVRTAGLGAYDESVVRQQLRAAPWRIRKIVLRCLARRPEDRFAHAGGLLPVWLQAVAAPRTRIYARRGLLGALATGAAGLLVAREFGYAPFGFGKHSLAVLPFRAAVPSLEPLADGLADQLITALSGARDVRVIARSSSFQYKGKQFSDIMLFARKVAADLLLVADVSTERDNYRVNAELYHAADGVQLWRESFIAATRATFQLQQQMASAVFRQLQIAFSRPLRPPPLPEAHELYLRAIYYWNKRDPDNLQRALDTFGKAVTLQPDYAEAWAGVSISYQLLASSRMPLETAAARAREAAQKALAIDSQLAEAHLSSALLSHRFDWDWQRGLREFRQTIDLTPGNARAHHWYAGCLSDLGLSEPALKEIEIAHSLDPLSFAVETAAVMYLFAARRFDEAVERASRVVEVEPNYFRVYPFLAA